MKVLVVGAGAVGTLFGAAFAKAGHGVTFLCREGAELTYHHGYFRVWHAGQVQVTLEAPAIYSLATLPEREFGLALFSVKAYDTEQAARALSERGVKAGFVVSLQNGIGNEQTIAEHFTGTMVAGCTTMSVHGARGIVVVDKAGKVGLAPFHGRVVPEEVVRLFSPFGVRLYDDARAMKWNKAFLNMVGNGVPALLGWRVEDVYSSWPAFKLELVALKEAARVMAASGIKPLNLLGHDVPGYLRLLKLPWPILYFLRPWLKAKIVSGRGGKVPSIASDVDSGRARSEAPWLYGVVAREGGRLRIPTPVCGLLAETLGTQGVINRRPYLNKPQAVLQALSGL